jgi:protein tyrosine/serine phosphatase
MLANGAAPIGDLISRLADSTLQPAVIHCFGGKDRTGLTIALLLTALGVPRETVLDDYELTGSCRGGSGVSRRRRDVRGVRDRQGGRRGIAERTAMGDGDGA